MKKFDLEKALSGERVITRNGKEVTGLHLFDVDEYALCGVVDKSIHRWTKEGVFDLNSSQNDLDLFMPGEKKTMWVNVYGESGFYQLSDLYPTKEEALEHGGKTLIDTVPITFEI